VGDVDIAGIDLGTTNSAIAIWNPDSERAELLRNRDGGPLMPSVVYYEAGAEKPLVGARARGHLIDQPYAVAYSVKRFMGRTAEDEGVARDRDQVTFEVEEAAAHALELHVGPRRLTPTAVSAEVLRALKEDAAAALGRPVERAVITVPAYFEEPQRQATREAGALAGLDVRRIVSEPTAAALAFGLGAERQTVLVYDLGGGTFDVSVVSIDEGFFRVIGTSGNTHLGGDDFDRAAAEWLVAQFEREHGLNVPRDDPHVRARLLTAAEQAKIALSDYDVATVRIPGLVDSRDLEVRIDRGTLTELVTPLIDQSLDICAELLAGLEGKKRFEPDQIDQVLLVGGQTRMPAIMHALRRRFGWATNNEIDPDQAVAQGAAVLGARLCDYLTDRIRLWDVIPLSLGIELADGRFERIIRANAQIPVEIWRRGSNGFTTNRGGQDKIQFRIFQGERPLALDNASVGEVVLHLDEPREAGAARIACAFRVDQDGILHVRAEDEDGDGNGIETTFDRAYQLSPSEIDTTKRDAQAHAEEDAETSRRLAAREAQEAEVSATRSEV
jgi:molecular chaperone DnaK